MSVWNYAAGVGCFAVGVSFTLASINVFGVENGPHAVVAIVDGGSILSSEVDRAAGAGICAAVRDAHDLWLESLEFLIARRLVENEASRTGRSSHELLIVEVAAKLTPVPEHLVVQLATMRAGGQSPTPDLLRSAREELEARELQRLRERYLTKLADKSTIRRSPSAHLNVSRVLGTCSADRTEPKGGDPDRPEKDLNIASLTISRLPRLAPE
jgi:hypothetical protein